MVPRMNDDILALLFEVIERLERHIQANQYVAIAGVEGQRRLMLSNHDYLDNREAFEKRVAKYARDIEAVRWIFAVPQVWVINERDVATRELSPHPLRPGEQEAITWMAFDEADGVDYGRVPYTRRPNGEPVFGEPEVFTVPLHPGSLMPGYILLRSLMGDDNGIED